ncbi:MAG: adenine deaminase [Ruminococcaceae bacterium]|nr:adenine deaminase [Oscillospiraceae bacterium]
MFNKFCKKQLWECSKDLSAVAIGKTPAETVIKNAKLINVCTKEIIENTDVAIHSGRIALVGDASHCIGDNTNVIDANGMYIAPGMLDGHIHIESSMLSAREYARSVIPHGTTGIYYDPHEICNVLGFKGVEIMIKDAEKTPLKAMLTLPSCVPAVPGFEDNGATITSEDIREQMKLSEVVGLGEMMNFPGIQLSNDETHAITGETLKADKIVTGHYSIPETASGLNSYIAAGIRCCHESTRAEDALEKMRLGMYAMLREGSAWHDLKEVSKAVTQNEIDSRYAVLISDDTHPHTLIENGHLDHIVRRAIEEGVDPVTAVQMVTINCAQCFHMDNEIGSITPSKCADIIFIDNLENFNIKKVMIDGEMVAENGKMLCTFPESTYPEYSMNTMHVGEKITADTFKIKTDKKDKVTVRAIEIIPARVGDYERHITLDVKNGCIESDIKQDVLKTFVFERHNNTGKHGVGFVKGFNIKCGAMASTVAHDAHNLLVIGTNDQDMALAANTLIECGGGMCAVCDGKVLGCVELPLAGLMNTKSAEEMSQKVENLDKAWKKIGCDIVSPFMTMALIPLACLPELRLTNRGLVDCTTFNFADLEVE